MEEENDWIKAAEAVAGFPLKEKQKDVMEALLQDKDVFGILPTGYGKSACFGTFPAAYKKVIKMYSIGTPSLRQPPHMGPHGPSPLGGRI